MAGGVDYDVAVEVPKGSRNKYEMDLSTGHIRPFPSCEVAVNSTLVIRKGPPVSIGLILM
jgi:hypothetical protein